MNSRKGFMASQAEFRFRLFVMQFTKKPMIKSLTLIASAGFLLVAGAGVWRSFSDSRPTVATPAHALLATSELPLDGTAAVSRDSSSKQGEFAVTIIPLTKSPSVASDMMDYHGNPVYVRCDTCHTTRPADTTTRESKQLDLFHQFIKIQHGSFACVSCHDARNGYSGLHLADGTALEYTESIQLCAQCHGPQFRDYQKGSHGGMTGYWDLKRGPRERNQCRHCHDPHSPKYPIVQPVAGPRDRFAPQSKKDSHE